MNASPCTQGLRVFASLLATFSVICIARKILSVRLSSFVFLQKTPSMVFANVIVISAIVCMMCIITKGENVTSADVIAILKSQGWVQKRSKGSHHQFHHPDRSGLVTVPHPRKDIKPGTLAQIWRQAGIKP